MQFPEWFNFTYYNNTVYDYAFAAFSLIALVIVFALGKRFICFYLHRLAKRTATDFDDLFADALMKVGAPTFVVVSLFIATHQLALSDTLRQMIRYAFVVVLTVRIVIFLLDLSRYAVEKAYKKSRPNDPGADTVVKNLNFALKWAIWALGLVFILDNLGINISALVAGLGIGGIAVAMASQAILGDAFAALSIFVDKPFEVGDFIIVGDLLGTVEHVGLKTTRIRSLHGEQLIFSNADLTASRIKNYKRMQTRRIAFRIGVTYQTTSEQVKKIPGLVEAIVKKIEGIRLDRVHFLAFGDFSLNFEIVYYVLSPDYNIYMDKQQAINFALKEVFEKEDIEFAYPTQTLFVTKEGGK